jgi:glutamine synthetase
MKAGSDAAMAQGSAGSELVMFLYGDLSGLSRGRSFPRRDLADRLENGVGWVPADQALTPFDEIADPNPWGPLGDLRLLPDRHTEVRVDLWPDVSPLHFFLCDAVETDGAPWEACPRRLLKDALGELEGEARLRLVAAFEQEFHLSGLPRTGPAFSMEAQRVAEPFGPMLVEALEAGGVEPETFLPEYGPGQYEINCRPAEGVAAADRALTVREIVRETARRLGHRASFTPIVDPDGVGNGVHLHFSFRDEDGRPAAYDAERPGGVSEVAGQFVAGILRHLPALVGLTAPSVISYLRLTPHRWSAGFTAFGDRNREAAVRIAPIISIGGADPGGQFNFEYRAADAAACPHLALAAMVLAGLEGIREKLPDPPLVAADPAELSDDERERLGVRRLPRTLGEALDALEEDEVARSWFPPVLLECYLSLKRTEIRLLDGADPHEACARYLDVY